MSERSAAAAQARREAQSELRSSLDDTRRLATPQRVAQLDSLVHKGQQYIDTRERLEDQGLPLGEVIERSTPPLSAAFGDLDGLIASDDGAVRDAEASARQWHRLASGIGLGAGILLLLGFAGAMAGMNVLVRRPLLAITRSIGAFANGDEQARTTPEGAQELRETAATFNDLADRLARQDRERLAFLGGVAHDLRNPLSALKLATDAARRGQQPPSAERAAHALAIVGRQIDRLDRMVGDLLDATRIESGRLELRREVADVGAIVRQVVELYRPVSPEHAIVLVDPEERVLIDCDPVRIDQVVTNLLSNAIKYSPRGGRVTASVAVDGGRAIVAVSDEGMGIAPEDLPRIFEPFHRSGRSRELVPGVGLGLSVARKIVMGHGGTLDVASRVGAGSTFRVSLPLARAGPAAGLGTPLAATPPGP